MSRLEIRSIIESCRKSIVQFFHYLRETVNWKHYVAFSCGFAACGIITFEFTRKIKSLTRLQLLGVIAGNLGNYQMNTNKKWTQMNEINKILPYATTRPSNECLGLWNGKFDILNYDKYDTPIEMITKLKQFTSIMNKNL